MTRASIRFRLSLKLLERTITGLQALSRRLGRAPLRHSSQQTGIEGEQAAFFHVRRQGYTVVARRWRSAWSNGEVDLIAWEGDTLCFIEVKTRSTVDAFAPEFAVNQRKQDTLRRMAADYCKQLPWKSGQRQQLQTRFDVVSVYLNGPVPDVRLLRDFFR